MEQRIYKFTGEKEDLDTLEKAFRHIEFLGDVGASRNILIRVDGDGSGRIKVKKIERAIIYGELTIDNEKYNVEQNLGEGATVGIYDIG